MLFSQVNQGKGFPISTLGIEITDAALADACGLGNIDPQHGFARGPVVKGQAAIECALEWPLPPAGATLATIRPDADACGAMAVLALRAEGVAFTTDMLARIELVTRADCFDYGDWQAWAKAHPMPQAGETLLALSPHPHEFRVLAACIGLHGDDLPASVAMMREWLLRGTLPAQGEAEIARVDREAAAAWGAGLIQVKAKNGVATVRSTYRGAMALGYRLAPVVIAIGEVGGKRKITVGQFAAGFVDMAELVVRLNALEQGWGGSAVIIGSPQGQVAAVEEAPILEGVQSSMRCLVGYSGNCGG